MSCNSLTALFAVLALASLTGCAVMPYNDSFECPRQENGQCVSVTQAHELAIKGNPPVPAPKADDGSKKESTATGRVPTAADHEQNALRLELLTEYVKGNKTPAVRTPPVIMETIIMPYQTGFGTLAGERTLWIPVEDATWVWPDQFDGKDHSQIGAITK